MPTIHDILARGYFPRELPPAFSTEVFANAVVTKKGVKSQFTAEKLSAEVCVHNLVRSGGVRRHLGVPNPLTYAQLCKFSVQRWKDLSEFASQSSFSLTKPVDQKPGRAIQPDNNLDGRTQRRIAMRSTARFVLRTDISRFYPSVYTHSLPWAIHSKATTKHAVATKSLKSLWGDELDILLRNMNDKQTVGIPIGPDCSLLVAEVLLSAVDQALLQQLPWVEGIRFIDDYEFAVQYQWQAEQIASVLQSILSHFELALNPAKTSIIELPDSFEPLWTSRLRTFVFRDAGIMGQRNDLTAYFDLAFTFHKQDPDGGVLKYAIPRMNGITVEQDNWSLFESILSQCAMVEPATLPQICEQLQHYGAEGYQLNVTDWVSVTNLIVTERLALGQASEAVWAMWLMKQLRLPLSSQAADVIATCEDAFASLMGLGMASVGLADMKRLSSLNRFAEPEELFGKHWLLCYEGAYQGWLVPPSGNGTFSLSSEFNFLSTSGVSFFNINAAPLVPRRRVAGPSESDTSGTGGGGGGGYA